MKKTIVVIIPRWLSLFLGLPSGIAGLYLLFCGSAITLLTLGDYQSWPEYSHDRWRELLQKSGFYLIIGTVLAKSGRRLLFARQAPKDPVLLVETRS